MGNTRTAVLDTAKSEGWVDNGDGTVSKTFTGRMQMIIQQRITKIDDSNQEFKLPLLEIPGFGIREGSNPEGCSQ